MKISFCGAASGVTGSCHLIETDKYKVLLDCGQFQGGEDPDAMNRADFPFNPLPHREPQGILPRSTSSK